MNGFAFTLAGETLHALPTGALWWPDRRLLAVSDMHLGKSERIARLGGAFLPPYETRDTLIRLQGEVEALGPALVLSLGDTFDDQAAEAGLDAADQATILRLQAGRQWVWITGNHDPGLVGLPGSQMGEFALAGLVFRHIARAGAQGEISGHYHPKARLGSRGRSISRPCFLVDDARVILPAYGTYTGGLRSQSEPLDALMGPEARAVLTGPVPRAIPMPRRAG